MGNGSACRVLRVSRLPTPILFTATCAPTTRRAQMPPVRRQNRPRLHVRGPPALAQPRRRSSFGQASSDVDLGEQHELAHARNGHADACGKRGSLAWVVEHTKTQATSAPRAAGPPITRTVRPPDFTEAARASNSAFRPDESTKPTMARTSSTIGLPTARPSTAARRSLKAVISRSPETAMTPPARRRTSTLAVALGAERSALLPVGFTVDDDGGGSTSAAAGR